MSAYAIRSIRPHATPATMQTEVFINEQTPVRGPNGWSRSEMTTHQLAFPPLETWTLDTVRGVLFALRRFLPTHDVRDAEAVVTVDNRRGHPARVSLAVRARGWESEVFVPSLRGAGAAADLEDYNSRAFSKPMLAALRDLKAQSPIAMATLRPANDIACEPLSSAVDVTVPLVEVEIRKLLARFSADKQRAMLRLFSSAVDNITDDDE